MTEDVRIEPSPKRVRVMVGGQYVADSSRALLVWERPHYPTYYLPVEDLAADLEPEEKPGRSSAMGTSRFFTVVAGDRRVTGGAYTFPEFEPVGGHVALVWSRMDRWFEEDEEVFVHPRDPYKRVDILASSRPVRVEIDGSVVAESDRPTLLFETGLRTRYYLPRTDVRFDLLEPSPTVTACPYKGTAEYWSVVIEGRRHEDAVWSYPFPTVESARIAGLMCFYDETVDLYLDGRLTT